LQVAKAFGTLTLRTPTMMAEAKVPEDFTSGPNNNLIQDMDWLRHGIIKYGLGKEGRARFYGGLTPADEGGKRVLDMTAEEAEKFFEEKAANPEYGKSIAEF